MKKHNGTPSTKKIFLTVYFILLACLCAGVLLGRWLWAKWIIEWIRA